MKKWIAVICTLVIFVFAFFVQNQIKDNEDLGDGYYYLPPYEALDIGFPEGAVIYKSSQKTHLAILRCMAR
jgi:hypothetical protein